MDIVCQSCNTAFKIADDKVPQGKLVAMPCPKCKAKITIDTRKDQSPASNGKAGNGLIEEVATGKYDASDRPFDYVEPGAKTALLCAPDPAVKGRLKVALATLGFKVTEPASARDALKQMRFHLFDLVVVDELFDADVPDNNHVLKYLGRLAISQRRQMFVLLLSNEFRTNDNMAAFARSVNLVINHKNLEETEKILAACATDNDGFYRLFFESMKRTGKF
ncbi:MAG: zinc-ribbon domain-containing protein [Thermodesulfobacteriota bacterium]